MQLNHKIELLKVKTHKTYNVYRNVIGQVCWKITVYDKEYPDSVFKSHTTITNLNLQNINSEEFISFDKMTKSDIARKCINTHGGQSFIQALYRHFNDELSILRNSVNLIDMDVSKIPD